MKETNENCISDNSNSLIFSTNEQTITSEPSLRNSIILENPYKYTEHINIQTSDEQRYLEMDMPIIHNKDQSQSPLQNSQIKPSCESSNHIVTEGNTKKGNQSNKKR